MNHLFPYIERTLLRPGITIDEQYRALDEITQLGMAGLTVAPFWVRKIRRELGNNHPAALSAVVGYPFGYDRTETKQLATELALKDGATEIEVVMNSSAFFSPSSGWLKIEFAKLVTQVHTLEKMLTVVLESALLDQQQQRQLIKIATDAGCDFLKNATGAIAADFSVAAALQFRRDVSSSVGVKIVADGATGPELEKLVAAGVNRLSMEYPLT